MSCLPRLISYVFLVGGPIVRVETIIFIIIINTRYYYCVVKVASVIY